ACSTARMPVLDELVVRIWVRSNRPGIQLAGRVVLPRSIDPKSRTAATAIVRGASYNRPEHWQQLALSDIPKLLASEVRVMRSVPGATVDAREAFLDAAVLVIPGDGQGVEVVTDDLEIDGIVAVPASKLSTSQAITTTSRPNQHQKESSPRRSEGVSPESSEPSPPLRVQGEAIAVEGKAFLPRAIPWNGEPFKFLAERGFNAIQLASLPTSEQSVEATRNGLWFICAAPRPDSLMQSGLPANTERVLAWHLADEAGQSDPKYFQRWAELVREYDAANSRPVLIAPQAEWNAISKTADALLADQPLCLRMSGIEFDEWLAERRRLAQPGTPFWAAIPTQLGKTASAQAAALLGEPRLQPIADEQRVDSLVQIAATRGCRGFVFESDSSLSESDGATRRRAALLELVNNQLLLLEPWLVGGKAVGHVASSPVSPSQRATSAVVMHVDHARLLVPLSPESLPHSGDWSATAAAQSVNERRVFVVPGIPDSHQVFLLSPAEFRRLEAKRVAGGTNIVLEPGDDGYVLLTEDPQVIQSLRQQVARTAPRTVRLLREMVAMHIAAVSATSRELVQLGITANGTERELASAGNLAQQADRSLAGNRLDHAYQFAGTARRILRHAAAEQRRAVSLPGQFASYPLAVCYDTLAEHARFMRSLEMLRGDDNLLHGGDFEDLDEMVQVGWQHVNHPTPGVRSRAELSAISTQHGRYCLQLVAADRRISDSANRAPANPAIVAGGTLNDPFSAHQNAAESLPDTSAITPELPEADPAIVPAAPLWITSPAMPVEPGQLIEITGWVRVPKPLRGNASGLEIVDSLGGAELSLSAIETPAWQPFRMIRAVPKSTELRLTFVLSGLGSAQIDSVMVRTLGQPITRRLPAVERPSGIEKTSAAPPPRLHTDPRMR
ncbi:MAG: hypothetical protein L0Z07_07465, partial [Planctomycetes bacterium]|nr:hypothetical protein [Planctomycetota bacterium]